MEVVTAMFPHKQQRSPTRAPLPRHIWHKAVRHDISNIRRRAKARRRLIRHETRPLECTQREPSQRQPSPPLMSGVNTTLSPRVIIPPQKDLDTLGLLTFEVTIPQGTSLQQTEIACFKGLRKATRLLIRHARNLRRQKYGKDLIPCS